MLLAEEFTLLLLLPFELFLLLLGIFRLSFFFLFFLLCVSPCDLSRSLLSLFLQAFSCTLVLLFLLLLLLLLALGILSIFLLFLSLQLRQILFELLLAFLPLALLLLALQQGELLLLSAHLVKLDPIDVVKAGVIQARAGPA